MRQIFYIDVDEEIISVIGRLRKSPSRENIIVAPKRSALFQSIVNLRLLQHDARKNGKEIMIVSSDDQGRSLCEKANIRTQAFLDEEDAQNGVVQREQMLRQENMMPSEEYIDERDMSQNMQTAPQNILPRGNAIGSSDFFSPRTQSNERGFEDEANDEMFIPVPAKKISVRDNNPKRMTTLNSQRYSEMVEATKQASSVPPSLRGSQSFDLPVRTTPQAQEIRMRNEMVSNPVPSQPVKNSLASEYALPRQDEEVWSDPGINIESEADFFPPSTTSQPGSYFGNSIKPIQPPKPLPISPKHQISKPGSPYAHPQKEQLVHVSHALKTSFFFFGFISLCSVAVVCAYLFLPKADIVVALKTSSQKADFEFYGTAGTKVASAEDRKIPVRRIEVDKELTISFDATGTASLSDQKARGSLVIYNEYGNDPQTLVASTRFVAEDGHVFRLTNTIVVPGMTTSNGKNEPGAIEAAVIADQSGQEYNIAPTKFSVPGFSGSPKFDKFYAVSSKPMTNGGSDGSNATAISERDITNAKAAIRKKMKEEAIAALQGEIQPNEKILDEAVDASVVSEHATPQIGMIASSFDYHIKFHAQTLVFSEDVMKESIAALLSKQSSEEVSSPFQKSDITIDYGEPTADFSNDTLQIRMHAVGGSKSDINMNQLKSDLLGKDTEDISGILQKYPQINTLSLNIWPEILLKSVPSNADRVNIIIEDDSQK